MKKDYIYHENFGGLFDRETLRVREENYELPTIGLRVCVAPLDSVSRDLWDAMGEVTKHRDDKAWIQFDEPTVSCGVTMTGVWAKNCQICG